MGGRYGASDDGSSEYQDRRPEQTDREPEQRTVAEAVRSVTHQQQTTQKQQTAQDADDRTRTQSHETSSHTTDQSMFDAVRSATDSTQGQSLNIRPTVDQIVTTVVDTDEAVADVIAGNLTDLIQRVDEESFPDED